MQGKGKRSRPSCYKVPKTTAKKQGSYVPKAKGTGRKGTGRRGRQSGLDFGDVGDAESSDDDEFVVGEEEESSEDDDLLGDFVVEEEHDLLDDDVSELGFEDYLDGSSTMDKVYRNGKIWTEQPYGSIVLEPWLLFPTREVFLEVLRDFCIQEGFGLCVLKADNKRFTAACIMEACEWRIHASRLTDKISWAIKTIKGEHTTCGRLEENPMISSSWLCKHLLDVIKSSPEIPVEALQKITQERFRVIVKKRLFYKVKVMAKEQIYGGFAEAYSLLPRYAEVIKATNPGSYALISWTGSTGQVAPRFKSCFFSFAAQVRGFLRGCRPLIGIDGAHLSGYYKGILLSALGVDGNNEIFLIAYGIVDTESLESWEYFFRNLRICFEKEGCTKDDWCFISDRMRGVDAAVHGVFPKIAANAYNNYVFNKAMEKIMAFDADAAAYLDTTSEQWSRYMFDTSISCDHNTTNFVESFNACTKAHRDLPVLNLLEAIRVWSMKRIGARFDKAIDMEPGQLTEYATKVLETRSGESRFCHATPCGGGEFEVTDDNVTFPINLARLGCGCGKWQGCGIPCKHALRVMYNQRIDPIEYVSDYYKGAAYKATYGEHIHPMVDSSQWPDYKFTIYLTSTLQIGREVLADLQSRGKEE
ncbi:uncharacterized protein LOC104893303 [Beta vulgaris subsp. vulgaris]|uniref:uncharacterized protein LOC104893303 n=1 Tax=Beta vulgaris subsp. vulgaris TaxID=3555 RepID=UPI00203717B7|nr:uncharacterized protein LOC104893303 [Beta vulgaris subsp. vulgaris]